MPSRSFRPVGPNQPLEPVQGRWPSRGLLRYSLHTSRTFWSILLICTMIVRMSIAILALAHIVVGIAILYMPNCTASNETMKFGYGSVSEYFRRLVEFYFHSHRLHLDGLTPQCPRAEEWTRSRVWRHEMDVKKECAKT